MSKNIFKIILFFIFFVIINFVTGCGTYKPIGTNITTNVRDSIVYKKDTIKIEIKSEKLKIKIDTTIINDTIKIISESEKIEIQYWKNKAGELEVKCIQKAYKKNVEVEKKEQYQFKEVVMDKIIEVEKKVVPLWCWLVIGVMGFVIARMVVKI